MRVVLLLLVPLLLFSAWQYTRREENENRLALVASAVALRDVDVSCPGFWTRLVETTPNAGWVDFDEHGRPSDETSLSASTCASLERVWRGKHDSFSCVLTGGCDRRTLDAVGGVVTLAHESWHLRGVADEARTQCYAVQTTEAVARRLGARAPRCAGDRAACRRRRLPSAGGRVPLRRVPAWRRVRPAPPHDRVAERLAAQPRWTNTHGRTSPGRGELRRPATTKTPSSMSGSESGVLGAGGGPSREISS